MATRPTFNLKHFEQIAASMMNLLASVQGVITDYNIGSVNRTLLESVAMELEELYYRMYSALLDGIPGGVYDAFSFGLLPAAAAVGNVTFSRSTAAPESYLIPAGTVVSTATGIRFSTTTDVTLPQGNTSVVAQVLAETPGADGNVHANSIILLTSALLGVESVNNSASTAGGSDQEADDARQARFASYIVSLARSTADGLVVGAKTAELVDPVTGSITEKVKFAAVFEPYLTDPSQPVAILTLYIDDGSGGASVALVTKAQQVIDGYVDANGVRVMGYRAAGIIVNVHAVTLFTQNVTAQVTLAVGADQTAVDLNLRNAVSSVFDAIDISQGLDWAKLLTTMMVVTGVDTITLTVPSGNVAGLTGKRMRPGTITLTYV